MHSIFDVLTINSNIYWKHGRIDLKSKRLNSFLVNNNQSLRIAALGKLIFTSISLVLDSRENFHFFLFFLFGPLYWKMRKIILFVCLNSDTHDNLRTKSRRKFVLLLKYLYFQCMELIKCYNHGINEQFILYLSLLLIIYKDAPNINKFSLFII